MALIIALTIFIIGTFVSQTSSSTWIGNKLFASSTIQMNEADIALTNSVTVGAYAAVYECAHQYKYDRWNCPASAFFLNGTHPPIPKKKKAVEDINRETALVRAMTSAGITFTLTKNCSAGDFANCVCDSKFSRRRSGFEWGGCSDNYQFGAMVARQFLDSQESGAEPASLVNLHNNAAGRVAVKKTMRRMCKCHGVSGSCTTQTCWKQIGDFRSIGSYLKKAYKKAIKVEFVKGFLVGALGNRKLQKRHQRPGQRLDNRSRNFMDNKLGRSSANRRERKNRELSRNQIQVRDNDIDQSRFANRPRRGRASRSKKKKKQEENKAKKRQIIFLKDSPDYCKASASSPGVLGRKCSTDPKEKDPTESIKKCSKLCKSCGLKPVEQVVSVWTSCNCRFKWCCDVICESCKRKKVEITCVEP